MRPAVRAQAERAGQPAPERAAREPEPERLPCLVLRGEVRHQRDSKRSQKHFPQRQQGIAAEEPGSAHAAQIAAMQPARGYDRESLDVAAPRIGRTESAFLPASQRVLMNDPA